MLHCCEFDPKADMAHEWRGFPLVIHKRHIQVGQSLTVPVIAYLDLGSRLRFRQYLGSIVTNLALPQA